MERPFVAKNERERERLRALVNRLTDEELSLPMGNSWTIGAALAHIAFWDQRSLVLMKKWKQNGIESVAASPVDIDVMNDALLPLCLAISPRAAANLAITSAKEIDREIEQSPEELIAAIEGLGGKFRLRRSDHRRLHLDKIEAVLKNVG